MAEMFVCTEFNIILCANFSQCVFCSKHRPPSSQFVIADIPPMTITSKKMFIEHYSDSSSDSSLSSSGAETSGSAGGSSSSGKN